MADQAPEQRRAARIETSITCSVATATDAFEAAVVNLSKTGAAIIGPDGAATIDDTVTLMLERAEGLVTLALPGRVVRIEDRDERALYGIEFEPLPPDEERQLMMLLQLLAAGRGQGRREAPRIAARISVSCRTEEIFRAWLNDLSRGGLSVKCTRDVKIGETLEVSFGVPGVEGLVEVAGEVVTSQPQADGQFRLGVRFPPLPDDERQQVTQLLSVLLGISLPAAEILDDDDD